MEVRKIDTIGSIAELELSESIMQRVTNHGYSAQEIIIAARNHNLRKLEGIGDYVAKKIYNAVDEAGFIFKESPKSQAARNLLSAAFKYQAIKTEEYEAQNEFSNEQISMLLAFMSKKLTEREVALLKLRYGLAETEPMSRKAVGEQFYVTRERARQLEMKTLRKIRHHTKARFLAEIFPEFPGIPQDLKDTIKHDSSDVSYKGQPLEWLDLPIRAHNCLIRAKVNSVEELLQFTPEKLLKLRNFRKRDLADVQETLRKFGLSLKNQEN